MKQVINATEGGAKIKGTVQLSLKEVIEKYCQEPIDKSKIKPLLTLADDGDELVEKVIPLLKDDIKALKEIIVNSRKGMAVSHGIKTLIKRPEYQKLLPKNKRKLFDKLNKEAFKLAEGNSTIVTQIFFQKAISKLKKSRLKTIMIMSYKNFMFSEAAHIASLRNPLVNVAIYGASRAINTRALKVSGGINHFLQNKDDAITRIQRNYLILKAAYTAGSGLNKSYRKTLRLLKKYNKTKNNNLLIPSKKEKINLNDAEKYFEQGNWAHPLLDAIKLMKREKELGDTLQFKAEQIYQKAIKMKKEAIKRAKENEAEYHDKMTKLVKYNKYLEEAKKAGGKEKDFDTALELMKKAIKLMPDESEAQWGLATSLHHLERIKESLIEYKKLIEKFPENNTFRFEYGQVLLKDGELNLGLKEIGKVMEATDEFDNFLAHLGEIYAESKMHKEAIIAYESYLKKYPHDYKAWLCIAECYSCVGKKGKFQRAYDKALEISPDCTSKH